MNVPGGNTISAAEHTLAMMLAMARGIPAADRSMRTGGWERGRFVGAELEGKVLGIVGMGKIGREVAHRARSFGMEVLGFDPFVSGEDADRSRIAIVPLAELFERADFITVHTPLIKMTKSQIIQRGTELGVDFSLTMSCYDPDREAGRACGHCDACLIRAEGFAEAGLSDPAI